MRSIVRLGSRNATWKTTMLFESSPQLYQDLGCRPRSYISKLATQVQMPHNQLYQSIGHSKPGATFVSDEVTEGEILSRL
jgi:hypothetical protein